MAKMTKQEMEQKIAALEKDNALLTSVNKIYSNEIDAVHDYLDSLGIQKVEKLKDNHERPLSMLFRVSKALETVKKETLCLAENIRTAFAN